MSRHLAESKSLQIAMMQWRGETEGCRGFKDGLRELGHTVEYTELNAGQDKRELGRLMQKSCREETLSPQESAQNFNFGFSFVPAWHWGG
jgi:hypothetical protein